MKVSPFKVYVVARPSFEFEGLAGFLADRDLTWMEDQTASNAEKLVEVAGRVCYLSFSDDQTKIRYPNSAYVANLIAKGHESVLEHVSWTFILDGVSRGFTHQLVRHRVGFAFSQLSQQYHDESEATFVVPHGLTEGTPAYALWFDALHEIGNKYRALLNASLGSGPESRREFSRWMRSVARSLLPNATSTTIAVTANARALRHFFRVRGTIEGDYEMRKASVALLSLVKKDAPSLFLDLDVCKHVDGEEIVKVQQTSAG